MGIESLLIFLLIGALAGWLAGVVVAGYGFGLLGNIAVGVVGAFIAGLVLPRFGLVIGSGFVGAVLHATVGAIILLVVLGLVRRVAA